MTKKPPNVDAKLKVEATAKASAVASYKIKKNVSQIIPEDVTRARAGAWLTLISPITEWAGLRGDQLRHKRDLLRIQQEESLYRIGKKAAETIKALSAETHPVPTKFLVPFLEKASLEEPNDDLIDLWAALLVSAGINYSPHYIHFANIISQLSAQQAEIFVRLIGTTNERDAIMSLDSLSVDFARDFMQEFIMEAWQKKKQTAKKPNHVVEIVCSFLNIVGFEIVHVDVSRIEDATDGDGFAPEESNYQDDLKVDFDILAALGLVRYHDTGVFRLDERWNAKCMFYHLTTLGLSFAVACGIFEHGTGEVDSVIPPLSEQNQ